MNKKLKTAILTIAVICSVATIALPALAQYGLEETAKQAGLKEQGALSSKTVPEIIGYVISIFLGFLGIVFLVLMLYGGYLWMTSFGNTAKVTKAKDLIVDAAIGLIIVLAAYALSNFVIGALTKSTMGT
jgi:hypothetical protein